MPIAPDNARSGRAGASRVNATQLQLLSLLAQFFCLRTREAAALLRGREPGDSDERSVRRTLGILFGNGFVTRIPHFAYGQERGSAMYVYGLSDKGVRHAFAQGYATEATKTFDERSVRTLDHELEITAFHVALDRYSRRAGFQYSWRQRDLKRRVHPDAFFTVADPNDGGREFRYFLEVERAKLGNYRDGKPQIMRKLKAYYEYFNSTDCEKEWGFRQYRVIVVLRTEARRRGLLTALGAAYPHRMFWLTTEAAFRENIGGAILRTPKDHGEMSYGFLASERVPRAML
jgi:Replication-relaxation